MIKRTIFTFILTLGGLTIVFAQSSIDSLMSVRIAELDTSQTNSVIQGLANDFERIALVDEMNWLAYYYTAYAYIQMANSVRGKQIDVYCDQADTYLQHAEKIRPKDSEIFALYAYLYAIKVNVDPMIRGPKMGKKSADYIDLSIQADPENPRPYLIRAMGIYHTPKAFGGGAEKALPYVKKALEKYDTFQADYMNAPTWGKALTDELLNACYASF